MTGIYQNWGGVLEVIDSGFCDFLQYDNLKEVDGTLQFWDMKHNFHFLHDIKKSLKEDYEDIICRYKRRINKFQSVIQENTLFVRAVKDEKELFYIEKHEIEIQRVIKKENKENEIIFLIPTYMNGAQNIKLTNYKLDITCYLGEPHEVLRGLFDTNTAFIDYCTRNISERSRKDNLIYDLTKELKRAERRVQKLEEYCTQLEKLNC